MYKCFVIVALLLVFTHASQVKLKLKISGSSSSSEESASILAQKLSQQLAKGSIAGLKVYNYSLSYSNGTQTSGNVGSTGNPGTPNQGSTSASTSGSESKPTGSNVGDNAASSKGASLSLIGAIFLCLFTSKRSSLLAFVLFSALLFSNANAMGVYQNCRIIDDTTQFKLQWTVNSTYIHFAMEAKSQGWVAIGISLDGHMDSGSKAPGSDIFMAHFGQSCPNGCINDYSTLVYDKPILDSTQNLDFFAASNTNGIMTFEFGRPLKAQENKADLDIIVPSDMNIIWAVNTKTAPVDNNTFSKHDRRGPIVIDFSSASSCSGTDPDVGVEIIFDDINLSGFNQADFLSALGQLGVDSHRVQIESTEEIVPECADCSSIDFVYSDFAVPTDETTYVCMGFTFPVDKQHVIRMQPVVNNSAVLHHMILWVLLEGSPAYSTTPKICNMAPGNALPAFAWAPGAGDIIFPDITGYLIGSEAKVAYAVLNMHYNNPGHMTGQRDSSGVRLITTKTLRPQNAGMMLLGGSTQFIEIPPGSPNWMFSGSCTPQYTNYIGKNLTVFSSMAHMHYQGRKLWTEQYRAGKYLGNTIGESLNYDFNFQQSKSINAVIKPGDNLITRCVYDTTDKTIVTRGGEASAMEMCYNLIMYYPIIDVIACTGYETSGCECTYGQSCVNSSACNTPYSGEASCSSHKNCNTCSTDSGCIWCDSGYFVGCMVGDLKSACSSSLGGTVNKCGTVTGTPCSISHQGNCTSCVGDTKNSCGWCKGPDTNYQVGDVCISGPAQLQTQICDSLGGTLGC